MSAAQQMPDPEVTLASLAPVVRWVAWQTQERTPGKLTKVPYAGVGRKAKADSPNTWAARAAVEVVAPRLPRPFGSGGVGLMLGEHAGLAIGGIDLDTCRSAETGSLAPWAEEVVRQFGSYTEVSPSGTGVKVFFAYDPATLLRLRTIMQSEWGRQWKRKSHDDHPPAIELYLGNRFFAVTDQRLEATPAELRLVDTDLLLWLIDEAGPEFAGSRTEEQAEPKARQKRTNTRRRTFTGSDGSRSAAAFRTAAQVRRAGGTYEDFAEALDEDPDTAAWKAEKGTANGAREMHRAWDRADSPDAANDTGLLTESNVADRFASASADRLRYCHDAGSWFEWVGSHWQQDRKHQAFTYARRLTRELSRNEEAKVQITTGKAAFCGGVERFAQRDERIAVTAADWDRDPFLLATPGGVVDLRTGKMRAARPADMMTRITAVAPSRAVPPDLWLTFLDQTFGRDDAVIAFVKRWLGYCLTGDTREHALVFGHGDGGNGKGVLLNTTSRILGTYAAAAAMDTFVASQGDRHPADLAALRGARMVTASETEEGRAWAESRIKQMTGGDPITARFMRQDFFTYLPSFKLTIIGNHKPVLRNVDEAARRRFNLVAFPNKPPVKDLELPAKLEAEWPAILAWMIEGCLEWQNEGLNPPQAVKDTTSEYFEAQDMFGQWLAERCILDASLATKPSILLQNFLQWCQENGEPTADNKKLRGKLEHTPGVKYVRGNAGDLVRGIGLRPPDRGDRGGTWGSPH